VTHDADGKVETVRYSMLTSMLLNEVQKQSRANAQQAEQIRRLSAELAVERQDDASLRGSYEERLARVERTLASGDHGSTTRASN